MLIMKKANIFGAKNMSINSNEIKNSIGINAPIKVRAIYSTMFTNAYIDIILRHLSVAQECA